MGKDEHVQKALNDLAKKFESKKTKPKKMLESIVESLDKVGGITGLYGASNKYLRIKNHDGIYNIPLKIPTHKKGLGKNQKKYYDVIFSLVEYCLGNGVKKGNIQLHLGKGCSTKHYPKGLYQYLS